MSSHCQLRQLMGLALPGFAGLAAWGAMLALCAVWIELLRLVGRRARSVRCGA
ncbi:MAG: hypothetical protein H0W48_02735 [Methylibium sp.]|nr:hypothetical protein [Methylibium sp.]